MTALSVVVCTHNPDHERLTRTLAGLRAQSLPSDRWETLLIDNTSTPPLSLASLPSAPANTRLITESSPGLSSARRTGLNTASADIIVFVDDDNILAPDYLELTLSAFNRLPRVGALGGKSIPEFAAGLPPATWQAEFFSLLALRDLGDTELISGLRPANASPSVPDEYPLCSPIGAGMALRRTAAAPWLARTGSPLTDRRGRELTSAGDNDIVLCALRDGWSVAYLPALKLTHLIPPARLDSAYLARLNRGIQKSWMQVLTLHHINSWPPVAPWTVPLRQLKTWFTYRAWSSPAARIRWQGACGHFEGRVRLPKAP